MVPNKGSNPDAGIKNGTIFQSDSDASINIKLVSYFIVLERSYICYLNKLESMFEKLISIMHHFIYGCPG